MFRQRLCSLGLVQIVLISALGYWGCGKSKPKETDAGTDSQSGSEGTDDTGASSDTGTLSEDTESQSNTATADDTATTDDTGSSSDTGAFPTDTESQSSSETGSDTRTDEVDSDTNCNPEAYDFIVDSLIEHTMTNGDPEDEGVDVLLVPLKNPNPVDTPEHPCDFKDVYHLFTASVVMAETVHRGDLDIAKKIAEFYLQLFETPPSHPELWGESGDFIGFPEVYKNKLGCEHLDELIIEKDPGNPDFEANSIVYVRMKDYMKMDESLLTAEIMRLSGLASDCTAEEIDGLEDFRILDALNKAVIDSDLYLLFRDSGGSAEMLHEEVRATYNAHLDGTFIIDDQDPEDIYEKIRAYMYMNRSFLKRFFEEAFAYDDLYKVQYRGSGPTSWWAIALFKLYAALDPDDSDDMVLRGRIEDLLDAIGGWLIRLQNEGLDAYLLDKGQTRDDVPWLDGGVVGALNERTLDVLSGPFTEASAAAYSVLRQLQLMYENRDQERFDRYKTAADRLGGWFRYVIDGDTGRAYVGRALDGSHIEGLPGTVAEAIDPYAFLTGAGVVDTDLAMKLLDRVTECGARTGVTDEDGRVVSGLMFGPQGDAPYWGPHAQVTQQALRLGHPMGEAWLADLYTAEDECRLSVFTPDGSLDDYDRVGDWQGVKNDQVWIGRKIWDLEVMTWFSMLADRTYNMLAPAAIPWDPVVHDGDPLLLPPGRHDLVTLSPDDGGSPSSPMAGVSASDATFILDTDSDYLTITEGETRNGEATYSITSSDSGEPFDEKIWVIRYGIPVAFPGGEYLFYIKKLSGDLTLKIELKDNNQNQSHFPLEAAPETGVWRRAAVDMLGLWDDGVDRNNIQEILIHVTGVGSLELQGFADPNQLMPSP